MCIPNIKINEDPNDRISERLKFCPTIQGYNDKVWLVINESNFVTMTMFLFEDDYKYVRNVAATIDKNFKRTTPNVLMARDFNGFGMPTLDPLPKSDFDPFEWRFKLPEKFRDYITKNEFIFDVHGAEFKILFEESHDIALDRIKEIKYRVEKVKGEIDFQ